MRSGLVTRQIFCRGTRSGMIAIKIVLDMNEWPGEPHTALSKVARNGATQFAPSLTAMLAAV
jgi:hypothetical protein